jgi:hypothetical protein
MLLNYCELLACEIAFFEPVSYTSSTLYRTSPYPARRSDGLPFEPLISTECGKNGGGVTEPEQCRFHRAKSEICRREYKPQTTAKIFCHHENQIMGTFTLRMPIFVAYPKRPPPENDRLVCHVPCRTRCLHPCHRSCHCSRHRLPYLLRFLRQASDQLERLVSSPRSASGPGRDPHLNTPRQIGVCRWRKPPSTRHHRTTRFAPAVQHGDKMKQIEPPLACQHAIGAPLSPARMQTTAKGSTLETALTSENAPSGRWAMPPRLGRVAS